MLFNAVKRATVHDFHGLIAIGAVLVVWPFSVSLLGGTWHEAGLGLQGVLALLLLVTWIAGLWNEIPGALARLLLLPGLPLLFLTLQMSVGLHEVIAAVALVGVIGIAVRLPLQSALAGVATIALLAQVGLVQFAIQSPLGLAYVGEVQVGVPGTATITTVNGMRLLRPYGLTLHANVYGGIAVIGYGFLVYLRLAAHRLRSWSHAIEVLLLLAALLSMSRAVWLALLLPLAISLLCARRRFAWWKIVAALALILTPLMLARVTDSKDVAVTDRLAGQAWYWEIVADQVPWFGYGTGGYVAALDAHLHERALDIEEWDIAPVHSAPLLLVAELGIVQLLILIGTSVYVLSRTGRVWVGAVALLLPLLLFDHYLATDFQALFVAVLLISVFSGAKNLVPVSCYTK